MYIIDTCCVSPQETFSGLIFEGKLKDCSEDKFFVIEPDYSNLIPNSILRRSNKALRISLACGMSLVSRNRELQGILIGTSSAGDEGCVRFVEEIKKYNEGILTPTSFVQSTPNSINGNLSIMSKYSTYSITHASKVLSFENVLIDAKMLFEENLAQMLLVGGVDVMTNYKNNIERVESLLGEGCSMFILSKKKENAKCKIIDIDQVSNIKESEINLFVTRFLKRNDISIDEVDALILGLNGRIENDKSYDAIISSFQNRDIYLYKNLIGDYSTSVGFATWLSYSLFSGKNVPVNFCLKETNKNVKLILIYNNYTDRRHGFILIRKVD